MAIDPRVPTEGFIRLTYEIDEGRGWGEPAQRHPRPLGNIGSRGDGSRRKAEPGEGGGWLWIPSDLKSLLESGQPMNTQAGSRQETGRARADGAPGRMAYFRRYSPA